MAFLKALLLLNNFINDIETGIEFMDDTKLSSVVGTLEVRDTTQRNLDGLEEWNHMDLMKYNKIPACGSGQSSLLLQTGWWMDWEQPSREERKGTGGWKIEQEPTCICFRLHPFQPKPFRVSIDELTPNYTAS